MAPFRHKPLDNNNYEIRIFEFWPVGPQLHPHFCGRLEHISLINDKPYDALSYCWGIRTEGHSVTIRSVVADDHIDITDNLQSALEALWKRRGEKEIIRIWVDALCINQNDLSERSQQVQMMRQIYSTAENVLAWVGSATPIVLSSVNKAVHDLFFNTDLPTDAALHVMKDFFNEEYWRRVWIIQEITVASTVVMLYGNIEFSWTELAHALKQILKHSAPERDESEIDIGSNGIGASHILKFREHWVDTNKPITLRQAMLWTLHTKATDPRDKIFALLGLCDDGFRLVPFPNYKQSLESIISEMSKLSFSRTRSLDLMCLKGTGTIPKDSTGLPTWAPNWPNLWSSNTTLHEKVVLRSPTTLNRDPVLEKSTSSILKVEAIFFAYIYGISSALETENGHRHSTKLQKSPSTWIYYTEKLREEIPELGAAAEVDFRRRLSIWKTLLMESSGSDIDLEIGDCFGALWTPQGRGSIYDIHVIDWIDKNAWFKIGPWTLREWSQLRTPDLSETHQSPGSSSSIGLNAKQLAAQAQSISKRRTQAWDTTNQALEKVLGSGLRLAEIGTGRLGNLGLRIPALVNPNAETGDMIFFLKGCRTPFALRLVHGNYEVMGGVWLPSGLDSYQDWSEGKGDVPDGAHVAILDLI